MPAAHERIIAGAMSGTSADGVDVALTAVTARPALPVPTLLCWTTFAVGDPRGTLAILVGGGPAPGINAVIAATTIEAVNERLDVLGIQDGFKWLVRRDAEPVAAEA